MWSQRFHAAPTTAAHRLPRLVSSSMPFRIRRFGSSLPISRAVFLPTRPGPRPPSTRTVRLFTFSPRRPREPRRFDQEPDYDPSRGDPWYYYRRRNAKPLLTESQLGRFVRSPRTHTVVVLAILAGVAFYFAHLQTVPVSGRRRFNCFSEEAVREVAEMQHKRLLYDLERSGGRFLPEWDRRAVLVGRVMRRLIPVSGMEGLDWEVRVIDDPGKANAFVLPGGKVFVFSGIIPLARTESGLAAVLAHEVAHNLADHVGERLSQSIGTNILLGSVFLLSFAIPAGLLAVSFLGSSVLDLLFERPMGRLQESEADYIGLMMMAEACYDPREAATFWMRMDQATKDEVPEWISTHPSNEHRIEKIKQWLPKAMEKRHASDCHGTQGFAEMFRRAMERGDIMV